MSLEPSETLHKFLAAPTRDSGIRHRKFLVPHPRPTKLQAVTKRGLLLSAALKWMDGYLCSPASTSLMCLCRATLHLGHPPRTAEADR